MIKTFRDSLRLLATRRFGTFWFASLLSSIGTWAQQVAEPWLLLTLGASSFLIGLDSFAMNAPVLLLTLVGGVLADRADRRRVIALFQSIQMLCPTAIVILLVTGHGETVDDHRALGGGRRDRCAVDAVVLSRSCRRSFRESRSAAALALNSTQFSLSRILGPSIAGVLISSVGAMACFVVSAVSYVPFIGVALWILPRLERPRRRAQGRPHVGRPLAGIREIVRVPHLRGRAAHRSRAPASSADRSSPSFPCW